MSRFSMRPFAWVAFMLLLSVISASCRHKELDDEPSSKVRVRVVYDWSLAPEAHATSMAAFFYDPATGRHRRFDFIGDSGGEILLEEGEWNIVSYNTDTPGIMFASENLFDAHEAFTREGHVLEGALGNAIAPAPRADESERVVITPDELWGTTSVSHIVKVDPSTGTATVLLTPEPLVCHYSYEIRNVTNAEHITRACGALSGMSGRLRFHGQGLDREPVTLPFESRVNSAGTITGEFLTFGHHEENFDPHRVSLYLWMDDGRKLAYGTTRADRWDVTSQIHAAPDRRRVHFIIDGLDIPVNVTSGGFSPSADDWGEEVVEVEVPL